MVIGAVAPGLVGCKAGAKRGGAPASSSATAVTLGQGAAALREAIAARQLSENARGLALSTAYRTKVPSAGAGACEPAVTRIEAAELRALTAVTDVQKGSDPRWVSRRLQLLEGALASVERASRTLGPATADNGAELADRARKLATVPEPRFDFQLVVEDKLSPTVTNDGGFTPGFTKGVLLAYDRDNGAVVCGARVAGANRQDALGRIGLRPGFGSDAVPRETSEAALEDDLLAMTLEGAREKLVAMAPAPR